MDMITKDLRQFKFKFDDAHGYHKAIVAVGYQAAIKKPKDFFAYDYAKHCREA